MFKTVTVLRKRKTSWMLNMDKLSWSIPPVLESVVKPLPSGPPV